MSLTKIHKVIKKYRELHRKHILSWDESQKKIRAGASYSNESFNYMRDGDNLFNSMIKELEGQEVFPKKVKNKILNS
jgi:hypothetical protein